MIAIAREDARPVRRRSRARPAAADATAGWGPAGLSRLEAAIVEAVAYADVFDWPLSPAEIHRYLPLAATFDAVAAALDERSIGRYVRNVDGYVTLAGRSGLASGRRRREAVARRLKPGAIRFGRIVAGLPFVRLVAVTGSLALDAADEAADVDLLVVTEDGRVWLARAFTMVVVRAAALARTSLCPNYLVAESSLRMDDRSVFTAHELAQMIPVAPSATYAELLRQNAWHRDYLPNAQPRPALSAGPAPRAGRLLRRAAEAALRSGLGDRIERWEMERKVRRLAASSSSAETRYDATCCKGHTEEHGASSLAAFRARLHRLEAGA